MALSPRQLVVPITLWFLFSAGVSIHRPARAERSAGFSRFLLDIKGSVEPYSPRTALVLPGETLTIGVDAVSESVRVQALPSGGNTRQIAPQKWIWEPPQEPGIYPIVFYDLETKEMQTVNGIVMRQASEVKKGVLNGYRIGRYPKRLPAGYETPRGFIEVTRENEETFISPHFQLKQFTCKQSAGYPKYLTLSEGLVSKLERLLDKAFENGFLWSGFKILSGFRTPYHNGRQRTASLSRHMWGDAADITVDENNDGKMDDLNLDKKVDIQDSVLLHDLVQALEDEETEGVQVGGVGVYARTRHHGPFVHVDARGHKARWVKGVRRRVASRFSSSLK